jgi:hypothetical protein
MTVFQVAVPLPPGSESPQFIPRDVNPAAAFKGS